MSASRKATEAYVAPFVVFVALMAVERSVGLPVPLSYPIRILGATLALVLFSRGVVPWWPARPLSSVALGIAVFLVWIAPDVLFGPSYRNFWLFDNALVGHPSTPLPFPLRHAAAYLAVRTAGTAILVPILEELFWRGWLMRWLIHSDFETVPIGQYARAAFWIAAVLFAVEHGSYWDVGLAAGILYNWWVVRSRSLADAILAHAVTNGLLAAYVLLFDQWQYWP